MKGFKQSVKSDLSHFIFCGAEIVSIILTGDILEDEAVCEEPVVGLHGEGEVLVVGDDLRLPPPGDAGGWVTWLEILLSYYYPTIIL